MRMTDNLITSRYISTLNRSRYNLDTLSEKVTSGRKYTRASEATSDAIKAFGVRKEIRRLELYRSNLSHVSSLLTSVETAVSTINDVLGEAKTLILQGRSGTYSASDRDVVANTLRIMQEQILSAGNAQFGDIYIFGGSNYKTPPFTLDSSGNLLYNGVNVDTGTFADDPVYLDVGIGLIVDASGTVEPQSAFNISNPGSELLGTGIDSNGITNNLYNLLGEIADMFDSNDLTNLDAYVDKLEQRAGDILVTYAGIGEKANFIEFLDTRYSNLSTDALERQNSLEAADTALSIVEYQSQKNAYTATLQMGSNLIQYSLMDYLK